MFELLLLTLFFALVLWFLLPEGKPASSRRNRPGARRLPPGPALQGHPRRPQDDAERWVHSGRR